MEALKLFSAQPDKGRSEFVIDCILKTQQENRLEEVIRHTIIESLSGLTVTAPGKLDASSELQPTKNITELPEALLYAMDDI